MSARRHITTGFMAAELDPHLDGRIDTDQHAFGLSNCENFVAINEGPLVKRQGFEIVTGADPSSTWLSAFRRSIEQEYCLEWGELKLRFFTNGARIETSPGVAYEVVTPYTAAQAPSVSQQQSFDRLYLAHEAHPLAAIVRETPSTFAYEVLDLEDGPFLDNNSDEALTVSANGVTGAVTLTGNAGFSADHVGALFRIEALDFADIPQWEPGMKGVVIGDKVRNRGNVYQAETAGVTGQVEPEHTEGSYYDGQTLKDELNDKGPFGVKWQHVHGRFGTVRITAVASASEATGTVVRRLPDSLTTVASHRWAHSAFSAAEGWPHLVTLFQERLITFKDIDIIGSVAGDYAGGRVNFSQFTVNGQIAADLAFRRTMSLADRPLWVSSDRRLLLGTASAEMAISPTNSGSALSGTNIASEAQSFYGSEPVFPVRIGTETLFVERGGRRCRAADYDFARDRYDARDLNATSREITRGGIVQLAYQKVPHALAVAARGDGQLLCHAKTRSDIFGWTRWVLGGGARVLSLVSVVGADGKSDDLWCLIERENGEGVTVKEIWRQTAWRELGTDVAESYYVDGGARFEASGDQTEFSVPHLANQDVAVLAGGVVIPNQTVAADGTLTLPADQVPSDPYTLIVGLGYVATATSMKPELRDGRGSLAGLRQRVVKTIVRVIETLGLSTKAPDQDVAEPLILRRGGQLMDRQIPLVTEDVEGLIDASVERDGRTTWVSDVPLPATIALVANNMEVSQADA